MMANQAASAYESNTWEMIAAAMILTPISTLFVGARVYGCVYILKRRLYFEEWLSVVSLVRCFPSFVKAAKALIQNPEEPRG